MEKNTKQITDAFERFDVGKKGYLTKEECEKCQSYLINELKYEIDYVNTALKIFDQPPSSKATLSDITTKLEAYFAQSPTHPVATSPKMKAAIALFSTAEQTIPAIRIVYVLKLIKSKNEVTPELMKEIDWCIEQIASGKIYESQLSNDDKSSEYQATIKIQAMPWLAQFSTPSVPAEEIQAYLKETGIKYDQNKEAAKKREQERAQRRSVMAKDIVNSLQSIESYLETLNSENFNVYDAERIMGRARVLPMISYRIFQMHDLFNATKIDENAFVAFLSQIRKGYVQENPYHNDLHAADVLQTCHLILTKGEAIKIARLNPLDIVALLISAIIHDFKHPGVTNGFLQNSTNDLAIIHNDRSILESFHVSEAYKVILKEKDCNLFEKLTKSESVVMRKRIISCVLATDMAQHNEEMQKMQHILTINGIKKGKNNTKIINPKSEFESKQFILDFILHVADCANPARSFSIYKESVTRILEEFGRQGDIEKSLMLPVSFLCDRTTINIPISQIGFINGITMPMFTKLAEIFPQMEGMLNNVKRNEQEWKKMAK